MVVTPTARAAIVLAYGLGAIACLLLLGFYLVRPFSLMALGGDNVATLVYAKSYINGFGFRLNPSLGFPGVQDNLFFPSFDFSFRAFLRLAGLFSPGAGTSYYLMYVAGICGMFFTTAASLRVLGFRHWIAFIGAVVYVVSPYFVFRSLLHDFLSLYFAAPMGCALALRLATLPNDNVFRTFLRGAFVPIAVLVVATSGLYYAFFSVLFIAFLGATASLSQVNYRQLLIAAALAIVIFAIVVVTGFGAGLIDVLNGSVPMVQRIPEQQLAYGLSLAEAIHLFDGVESLQWAYKEYTEFRRYLTNATGLEEWPGFFLTLVIFLSPLIAASVAQSREYWPRLIFLCAAAILFGIIYSVNGGLAYYFNLFVSPSIRATARVLPFLSFFALTISLASVEILLERERHPTNALAVAIVALLLACMTPTIGQFGLRQNDISSRPDHVANLTSARNVLAAKDLNGVTAVLQLPHIAWPEAEDPPKGFDPYSLQNYFILDKRGSKTKWSYGSNVRQEGFSKVKDAIDSHPDTGLVAAADQLGFDGAIVEKKAMTGAEVDRLSANLGKNACRIYEDDLRIMFAFRAC